MRLPCWDTYVTIHNFSKNLKFLLTFFKKSVSWGQAEAKDRDVLPLGRAEDIRIWGWYSTQVHREYGSRLREDGFLAWSLGD